MTTTTPAALPALLISHGAPLFFLDAGSTGPALTRWGQGLQASGKGLRSMTHNLQEIFGGAHTPAPYVRAFIRWVEAAVECGDKAASLDHRRQAPHAERAHPIEDHFYRCFLRSVRRAGGRAGKPGARRLPEPRSEVWHAGHGFVCTKPDTRNCLKAIL